MANAYWVDREYFLRAVAVGSEVRGDLGLLTGRALRVLQRPGRPHRWRTVLGPLATGLTLLGLYGAGEVHTDVGAHLTGFAAGLVLGFAAALARHADTAGRSST